jgi:hypothetical protein
VVQQHAERTGTHSIVVRFYNLDEAILLSCSTVMLYTFRGSVPITFLLVIGYHVTDILD